MAYYLGKTLPIAFEEAITRTVEALKKEGFGIISDIDIKETLKKKINVDYPSYRILGACNPALAHEAQVEREVRGGLERRVRRLGLGREALHVAAEEAQLGDVVDTGIEVRATAII